MASNWGRGFFLFSSTWEGLSNIKVLSPLPISLHEQGFAGLKATTRAGRTEELRHRP